MNTKAWIEATRPRTLPVSVAGVLAGCATAVMAGGFSWPQALICFFFALTAQVVSNFANEYYDFKNGLDKKGREGFRRGVTEGDISPGAMKRATYALLAVDCLLGCSLIYWGGWWLLPVGAAIALFALAYSTGPYPLSHHGLGDIAVVIFFGIVPVYFTAYVMIPSPLLWRTALPVGMATGLLAANVLIVNNYRDMDDDRAVGKHTTVVIFGRKAMRMVYLLNVTAACIMLMYVVSACVASSTGRFVVSLSWTLVWGFGAAIFYRMNKLTGKELNKLLKLTAMLMLFACLLLLISALLSRYLTH